nr:ARF16 [Lilium hybrid cultivar]
MHQGSTLSSPRSLEPSSLSQGLQFQRPGEQQALLQKQQLHHHQLQLLQKLQEQQVLSQLYPNVQPSELPQQLILQNQQLQHNQYLQQQQQLSGTDFSTVQLRQLQQISANHISGHQNPQLLVRSRSTPTEADAPSCSTSPSTNNHVSPSRSLNRSQQRPSGLADELFGPPVDNLLQEFESKPNGGMKEKNRLSDQHGITDQLDASSATSFSLDGNAQEGFSMPLGLDGDIHVDPRNSFLIRANSDSLIPNAQLSRGSSSGKDMQDLFSSYGNPKDVETEVSTAAISSQSFGVPYASFKPGCSNDVVANENGIANRVWGNQPQRMRTYTKV